MWQAGESALHQAACWCNEECLAVLLERGADPNLQNKVQGCRVLQGGGAGQWDKRQCVRMLVCACMRVVCSEFFECTFMPCVNSGGTPSATQGCGHNADSDLLQRE